MKEFENWQLPNTEEHVIAWMLRQQQAVPDHLGRARLTYQYHKYQKALFHTPGRRRAVDVGAHVGLWSYWMARDFQALDAFEPAAEHIECWMRNVIPWFSGQPVTMHATALGAHNGIGSLVVDAQDCTGATRVLLGGGDTPIVALDSFDFVDVDLLKIDCEGFEAEVVKGARKTLERSQPTIIVEQKRNANAVSLLERMGYRMKEVVTGDYIMVPGD